MRLERQLTDETVLAELGRRVAQTRLERNLSQAELGAAAGVGLATVQRLERGDSIALTLFVRVLRALDLLKSLDRAVPEPLPSPLEQLKLHGRRRRRAGHSRTRRESDGDETRRWRWGDEGDEP